VVGDEHTAAGLVDRVNLRLPKIVVCRFGAARAWSSRVSRRHPVLTMIGRRIAVGVVLLFVVSLLVFLATQALGDPAKAILGRQASPATVAALRRQLGLDHPLLAQYEQWLGHFVQGEFGRSLSSRQPVTQYLATPLKNTLVLALLVVLITIPLAIALGVWSGVRATRPVDHLIAGISLAAIAVPEFVVGTVLVLVFAVKLQLLPAVAIVPPGAGPLDNLRAIVLPVATLVITGTAYLVRMVRAGVIHAMASEYVTMARLNGLSERRVIWRHGLRNALAPTIQVLAQTVQWLIGGVVVTEIVFAYPGFGRAFVSAVNDRDIPVVQAAVLLLAAFYIAINILADVAVVLVVPKLRTAQ
jgi:peptide/nickel transport system permease protein